MFILRHKIRVIPSSVFKLIKTDGLLQLCITFRYFCIWLKTKSVLTHNLSSFVTFSSSDGHQEFLSRLNKTLQACKRPRMRIKVKMIVCNHTRHPAWAQNEAMMTAYQDIIDGDYNQFFYMVNDDTQFLSQHWTPLLINALKVIRHYSYPTKKGNLPHVDFFLKFSSEC